MQRHVGGFWGFTEDRSALILSWALGDGHDPVSGVYDVTGDLKQEPLLIRYKDSIQLSYYQRVSGTRRILISFVSGREVTLNLLAANGERQYSLDSRSEFVCRVDSVEQGLGLRMGVLRENEIRTPATYAIMPVKDPLKRFDFNGTWDQGLSNETVMFSSNRMKKVFGGGTVSRDTPSEQFVQFAAVIGTSGLQNFEVWDAVISGQFPTVTGFVWAEGLRPLPKNVSRTFEVCHDPNSPSYFRSTGNDSNGNAIPQEYLNGTLPAIFRSGGCSVPSRVQVAVVGQRESSQGAGDGSLTVTVLSSSVTPRPPAYLDDSLFQQDKYPSFPALGSQDFVFNLNLHDGSTLTSGTITGSTYTFSGLGDIDFPYELIVEEDATGEEVRVYGELRDPSKTPPIQGIDLRNPDTDLRWTDRFPYGDKSYQPVDARSCYCQVAGSINYQPMGGPAGDPCNICFECENNVLHQGGNVHGGQLVTASVLSVHATEAGNDGQVWVNGQLNPSLGLELFILNSNPTYDMHLFQVLSQGTPPTGAPLQSETGLNAPNFNFTGLQMGWYMVRVIIDGHTCHSNFWVFVNGNQQHICNHDVSTYIDPCTGNLTVSVVSDAVEEGGYTISVNGEQIELPYSVSPGDVIVISARLPECTEDLHYERTVREADRECNDLIQGPVGCMDPTALNFDPTAQIPSELCIYDDNVPEHSPCEELRVGNVTLDGNIPTVNFIEPQSNFTVTWQSFETGFFQSTETAQGPQLGDGVYVVTVTFHDGCSEVFVIGVNQDPVYGCMDPLAENFLPSATVPYDYALLTGAIPDGDPCRYRIPDSPCIPQDLQKNLRYLDRCLEKALDSYHNRLRSGRLTPCLEKNLKAAVLLRTLLHRRGLSCLFNCTDSATPSPQEASRQCGEKWAKGGPTGKELEFDIDTVYTTGDIVLHPDGKYYTFSGPAQSGQDPLIYTPDNPWSLCKDVHVPSGYNVLDSYISFLHRFCTECGISIKTIEPETGTSGPQRETTDDGEEIRINGSPLDFS